MTFGRLLGDPEFVGAGAHLGPDLVRMNSGAIPEYDQVVEEIGALPDDAVALARHGLERDFAAFLEDLLRDLAGAGREQLGSAWMAFGGYVGERAIEAIKLVGACQRGRMAAKYLLDRGLGKLAFLTPWPVSPSQHARGEGFGFTAYQNETKVEMIVPSPGEPQIVTESDFNDINHVEKCVALLVDRFLALSPRPTGLFVPLDFFTAIVYRQLDKRGIRPGRDLTIISANGELCFLAGLNPRPATIDIGGETIGRRAVEQLLSRIRNPKEARGLRMIVEPVIIEGDVNEENSI